MNAGPKKGVYHWYNNGEISVRRKECPEGFVPGKLPPSQETRDKISNTLKGRPGACKGIPKSAEARAKISQTRKERKIPPWNKGLTKEDPRVAKNSAATQKTRKERGGYTAWNKGLTMEDPRVAKNRENANRTIKERYGVDNVSQVFHRSWNTGLTKETDERVKKASDTHKGVTAWNRGLTEESDDRVKKYAEKNRSEESRAREYETRKRNNSFNTSKPEQLFKAYLVEKYGEDDVVYQYRTDSRYPYHCDFYIRSLDTFIELNLYWGHGGRPYDPEDSECQKKLERWRMKAKTSAAYENAIQTWTVRDPEKVLTAQQNNIHLIVIYDINEDTYSLI